MNFSTETYWARKEQDDIFKNAERRKKDLSTKNFTPSKSVLLPNKRLSKQKQRKFITFVLVLQEMKKGVL